MVTITEQQLDFLEQEITQRGIGHPELREQLLDHFACGIEREMAMGLGFHEAYHKVYLQVSPNGLEEINHQLTLVIIHKKYSAMKKFVFAFGFFAAFLFGVGYIFKGQHWPSANELILLGGAMFTFIFLPLYFRLKYKADREAGKQKHLVSYVLNCLLVMALCFAAPYKQFKWPGHQEIFLVGQLLLAFVLFPKVFIGWYRKFTETPSVA